MTQPAGTVGLPHQKNCVAVGISSAPNSSRLVLRAQELAVSTNARLIAIHVDTGAALVNADKERLDSNLDLVRSRGGEVVITVSPDPVQGLVAAAVAHGATTLVIGRSGLSGLGPLPHRATISDLILHEASPLDVVVVSDSEEKRRDFTFSSLRRYFRAPLHQYILLFTVFVVVTGLCAALSPYLGSRSVPIIYLTTVLLLSLVSAPGPTAVFAVISSLAYNYLFLPPHYTFAITSVEDIFIFVLYFVVSGVSGSLSSGLRTRERLLAKRDQTATLLLAAADCLTEANSIQNAATAIASLAGDYTKAAAVVYVAPDAKINQAEGLYSATGLVADAALLDAARYSVQTGKTCGRLSKIMPELQLRFVPAHSGRQIVAAIGYGSGARKNQVEEDDELFSALGRNLALFIERTQSMERNRQAALELESERLAKVLFDSVSHELKTPLTTITGSLSILSDSGAEISGAQQKELLDQSLDAAKKLNWTVEDFLSIGRIEAGRLSLKREPIESSDLAVMIANAFAGKERGRAIRAIDSGESMAYNIDAVLVSRAAVNLLDNAAKYSPPGGAIELRIATKNKGLSIVVRDEGPGFSPGRMESPFVKFRKVAGDKPGGLGLGLAICQGIAAAHGGRLEARRDGSGFLVELIIPDCAEAV